jgi:hypothetical protein
LAFGLRTGPGNPYMLSLYQGFARQMAIGDI